MKKVIITGATGMIGYSLINNLIDKGISITAVCRPNSKKVSNLPVNDLIHIVYCSLDELLTLQNKLDSNYDAFYHFAWDGTYGDDRNNILIQNKNIEYTLRAVELASKLNCKVFIGAGSQAEYGLQDKPLDSSTKTDPISGYGIGKYTAGKLSAIYAQQLGVRHIWARVLSAYGPGDNDYTLIMSTIIKLIQKEQVLFTAGDQIWDFIYSKDLAEIFYLLGIRKLNNKVYALGSGKVRYLKEYLNILAKEVDPSINLKFGDISYQKNQVMYLCANANELEKDINFKCKYSFEEGIKETIKWQLKRQR